MARTHEHFYILHYYLPNGKVRRVEFTGESNILELACGTGILTQHLVSHLSGLDELTATDN